DKTPPGLVSERAWLSTVVTRLCLDRLKSARASREEYVGPWLPEPVLLDAVPAPESEVLRRESITVAFLVLLETLSPTERAAFLLGEIFDYDYADIARILDTSEAAVRQLVHRAKERLTQGKRRFTASPERQREIVRRFLSAAQEGDLEGLEALLAEHATFTADGGGKVAAAKRVVEGAAAIAKLFVGLRQKAVKDLSAWHVEISEVNGEPAVLVFVQGQLDTVFILSIQDRIHSIHAIRNPDKLRWLEQRLPSSVRNRTV
ncbi:MAG: nuclear transport factor 2 family protein, partial [Bryobacteraceae bacterium]|nr:nuclear transport factor 2 family protein [Bryobacteraceae bacterium]